MSALAGIPDDATCSECGRGDQDMERTDTGYRCRSGWECESIQRRRRWNAAIREDDDE